jgi:hypothetical protein
MLGGTGDTLDASTAKKHLFPAAFATTSQQFDWSKIQSFIRR